jgi:aldehyde dehydrogenase (NAD+)
VEPTLVVGLPWTAELLRHELPGPVLAVLPYDSEDEAVAIANDPPYGLTAAVSGSPERAAAVARRLRAGAVTVNDGLPHGPDSPHQGMRGSGAAHAGGEAALRDYLTTKVVGFPG